MSRGGARGGKGGYSSPTGNLSPPPPRCIEYVKNNFKVTFYIKVTLKLLLHFLIIKNAIFLDEFPRQIVNLPKEDDCSTQLFAKLFFILFYVNVT